MATYLSNDHTRCKKLLVHSACPICAASFGHCFKSQFEIFTLKPFTMVTQASTSNIQSCEEYVAINVKSLNVAKNVSLISVFYIILSVLFIAIGYKYVRKSWLELFIVSIFFAVLFVVLLAYMIYTTIDYDNCVHLDYRIFCDSIGFGVNEFGIVKDLEDKEKTNNELEDKYITRLLHKHDNVETFSSNDVKIRKLYKKESVYIAIKTVKKYLRNKNITKKVREYLFYKNIIKKVREYLCKSCISDDNELHDLWENRVFVKVPANRVVIKGHNNCLLAALSDVLAWMLASLIAFAAKYEYKGDADNVIKNTVQIMFWVHIGEWLVYVITHRVFICNLDKESIMDTINSVCQRNGICYRGKSKGLNDDWCSFVWLTNAPDVRRKAWSKEPGMGIQYSNAIELYDESVAHVENTSTSIALLCGIYILGSAAMIALIVFRDKDVSRIPGTLLSLLVTFGTSSTTAYTLVGVNAGYAYVKSRRSYNICHAINDNYCILNKTAINSYMGGGVFRRAFERDARCFCSLFVSLYYTIFGKQIKFSEIIIKTSENEVAMDTKPTHNKPKRIKTKD